MFTSVFWDEREGLWRDYDLEEERHLSGFYAASLVPLLWECGPLNLTRQMMAYQRLTSLGVLDYPGGIPASLITNSTQQWDFPNVWAPLQWFPVFAWANSSSKTLRDAARSIAQKWVTTTYVGWERNTTMFEKVLELLSIQFSSTLGFSVQWSHDRLDILLGSASHWKAASCGAAIGTLGQALRALSSFFFLSLSTVRLHRGRSARERRGIHPPSRSTHHPYLSPYFSPCMINSLSHSSPCSVALGSHVFTVPLLSTVCPLARKCKQRRV